MAKKKKQSSKSVGYLILFVVAVCMLYEPLSKLFPEAKDKVEQVVEKAKKLTGEGKDLAEEVGKKVKIEIEERQEALSKGGNLTKLNLKKESRIALPAPLADRPEQILNRQSYTASYNRKMKQPNWVAWELTPEKLIERESRTNEFLPDPDLKVRDAVTTDDYKRSGWDRGHMCPAGDSKWHWRAMQESFYMTNISPQNHKLNSGDWRELEEACRRWAKEEGSIYIVCGPIFYAQKHETIGRNQRIPVPEAFFKVVLCMESNPPKGIGYVFENGFENKRLKEYARSIDEVERVTGIDFFASLPDELEKEVEFAYDVELWK